MLQSQYFKVTEPISQHETALNDTASLGMENLDGKIDDGKDIVNKN